MTVCRVAVSQATYAIDRLYDYYVPEQLIQDVVPGVRVLVPFGIGNRKCEAFVVTMGEDTGQYKLKTVLAVLDEAPVLSESLLHLAAQMCSGLYCTFYECAKSMLPTGLWFDRRESWSVCEDISDEQLAELAEKNSTLALFNKGARELTTRELAQACGGKVPTAALKTLQEKHILQFHSSFDRKVGDQTIRMYALDMPVEEAMRRVEHGRNTVRLDVVSCLASEGAMARRELMYLTGVSSSTLRLMVRQNILREWYEEAFRLPDFSNIPPAEPFVLNAEQQQAYDGMRVLLDRRQAAAALLFGVTGSGKTQVYLSLIRHALEQGRGAILLVPEIGLTPQMIRRFVSHFGEQTAVLHSALSVGERYDSWKRIQSGAARVVIGTRSAVFAPVNNLGLIVIDEEQDGAYKSEHPPRYHARDIAKYRVVRENALLVLGSATPSVETYYGAKCGRYPVFTLRERYAGTELPEVVIADLRGTAREGSIGDVLGQSIAQTLAQNKQTILFLNRRGAARQVTCTACGWTPECPSCSVSLTYHSANHRLMCHYCGRSIPLPMRCPECGSTHLKTEGTGTQKLEEELTGLFPQARILRMDADTTMSKNAHERLLKQFSEHEADILIGTQMVTKGLDFESVTLVGVVDADQSLRAQDYRARERAFSLITQVVGRAGRRSTQGRAVIQTYSPEHPVLLTAARQDYERFYENEIAMRQALMCPPIRQIVLLTAVGERERDVLAAMIRVKQRIEGLMNGAFADFRYPVLGPAPAVILRVNNRYRYHLTIRCPDGKRRRALIGGILKEFAGDNRNRGVSLFADVNPQDV